MVKKLLSGNESIAFGAYCAGVRVGTGYPGTPSTEILESLTSYSGIYTEWSVNEKVAFEVGLGAALSGVRTLVTMKHVGLNVAADPLFTSSYTGIRGGLVIVTADDPNMHSSQNEQDNRNYSAAAKVPMLEPSDSQEAKDFTEFAFHLSEEYDTPVLLRSTTRISHSKGVVLPESKGSGPKNFPSGFQRNLKKYVMIPAYARLRHPVVEDRITKLRKYADSIPINQVEMRSRDVGVITSGICYSYVREALPDASILKIGMVYPLPEKMIRDFTEHLENVVVIEELDPFFENQIKSMGIQIEGKRYFPLTGEFDPSLIRKNFPYQNRYAENEAVSPPGAMVSPRPPQLCPGCPHRTAFEVLKKLDAVISGDIGCYTLGVLPPFQAMDTCIEMGGSIGLAQGIELAEPENSGRPIVAVIGDSTFAHSGLTGLVNAAYNRRNILIMVLDNGTTAMTGMQPNPTSGERIDGSSAFRLNYEKLAEAVGIEDNFRIVDAYDSTLLENTVEELLGTKQLSLLVVKGTCVIHRRKKRKAKATSGT